jgi:hypothetical protein
MAESITRASEDVWCSSGDEIGGSILPIYKMGDYATVPYSMGCGTSRAYIGLGEFKAEESS